MKGVIEKYLKIIAFKKRNDSLLKRTSNTILESSQLKCSNFHQVFSSFINRIMETFVIFLEIWKLFQLSVMLLTTDIYFGFSLSYFWRNIFFTKLEIYMLLLQMRMVTLETSIRCKRQNPRSPFFLKLLT